MLKLNQCMKIAINHEDTVLMADTICNYKWISWLFRFIVLTSKTRDKVALCETSVILKYEVCNLCDCPDCIE